MKINLFVHANNRVSYDTRYEECRIAGHDGKSTRLTANLDSLADDAECEEIIGLDVLDYIPIVELLPIVQHWVSKLRHGGTLVLGGTDLLEVARCLINGEMNVFDANCILHGKQDEPNPYKYGQNSLVDMVEILEGLGLKIMKKDLTGTTMLIKAVRP